MERVNEATKSTIAGMLDATLKRDPAADLTVVLAEQARAYAQLRLHLAESAHNERTGTPVDDASDASEGSTFSASARDKEEWSTVLLEGSHIQIDHALDARVLRLACPDHHGNDDKTETTVGAFPTGAGLSEGQFVAGLNKALQQGEVLWRLFETMVIGLGASVVVKTSLSLDPDGAANLRYINEHLPALPALAFMGALTCGRRSYVFQSRARGTTLEAMWPSLSTNDKLSVQAQLSHILQTLRAGPNPRACISNQGRPATMAPPQPPHLGSFVLAICKDTRRVQRISEVLIDSEASFNDFLVTPPPRRTVPASIRMLRPSMRDDHPIVMTHADLHPRNIMADWVAPPVDGSGAPDEKNRRVIVTSILDWEMAGWYPAYWEFVKALCNASPRGPLADWPEYLPTDTIGTWPVEYALDSLLSRWLG